VGSHPASRIVAVKDVEARQKIAALETYLKENDLESAVSNKVIAYFKADVKRMNETIETINATGRSFDERLAAINDLIKQVDESSELIQVLEREVNDLRVDVRAIRAAQAEQAQSISRVLTLLQAFANNVDKVVTSG
jgi:prefoldin subunit 5